MTKQTQDILDELTLNYIPMTPIEFLYAIPGGGIQIPHDEYKGDDCAADYTWYSVEDWVAVVYDEDEINDLEDNHYDYVITALTEEFTERYRGHLNSQLRILNGEYNVEE